MARNRRRTKNSPSNINTSSPKTKYGLIPVNNLTYGNPNAAQDILVRKEGNFDYIANHYMDKPYPNNDGNYAHKELETIRKDMEKLQHDKVVELSIKFDEDLQGMLIDTAQKCGVANVNGFIKELFEDINPIIMKLKYFYNRIRPYQLANVTSFPLNPMPTVSAQSPSYPSGHTVQSRVFADILSFRYPDQQDMLEKFADKCSKSRIILGVHFPSDEVFGKQLAAGIVKDDNFKHKYFNAEKIAEGVSKSPIKNYANAHPENDPFGISNSINGQSQRQQHRQQKNQMNQGGSDIYRPPTTVNEDEIFGGIPKAPEGGMPFPGAPRP
jgi:hypothetical protein